MAGEIVISGCITKVYSLKLDRRPPRHQLFLVQVQGVEEADASVQVASQPDLLVCMQWGERGSPRSPIPALQVDETVRVRGVYVPPEAALFAPDQLQHPVLHWTHHPVGWVEYRSVRYGDDILPSRAVRWSQHQAEQAAQKRAARLRRTVAAHPPAGPAAFAADPPAPPV